MKDLETLANLIKKKKPIEGLYLVDENGDTYIIPYKDEIESRTLTMAESRILFKTRGAIYSETTERKPHIILREQAGNYKVVGKLPTTKEVEETIRRAEERIEKELEEHYRKARESHDPDFHNEPIGLMA